MIYDSVSYTVLFLGGATSFQLYHWVTIWRMKWLILYDRLSVMILRKWFHMIPNMFVTEHISG